MLPRHAKCVHDMLPHDVPPRHGSPRHTSTTPLHLLFMLPTTYIQENGDVVEVRRGHINHVVGATMSWGTATMSWAHFDLPMHFNFFYLINHGEKEILFSRLNRTRKEVSWWEEAESSEGYSQEAVPLPSGDRRPQRDPEVPEVDGTFNPETSLSTTCQRSLSRLVQDGELPVSVYCSSCSSRGQRETSGKHVR